MRIDNYRGWDDEKPPVNPGDKLPVPPTFDSSTLLGMDVSHHNNTVDFVKAKAAGCRFVFIKATEGEDFLDPMFNTFRAACKAAGLPRGFYHFFRVKDDVQTQVDFFVRSVGRLEPGDLPPVLDVEAPEDWTGFSVADRVSRIKAWLDGVEAALGVRPIIYINNPMTNDVLKNPSVFAGYTLWLAQYTSHPTAKVPLPWTAWTYWQYTEHGTIAGVNGDVDLNRYNGSMLQLQAMMPFGPAEEAADMTVFGRIRSWLRRLLGWLGF